MSDIAGAGMSHNEPKTDIPYTPTTDEVRAEYVQGYEPYADVAGDFFDRWLAEHDRQVAQKAWDEGYDAGEMCGLTAAQDDHECTPNPYETGDCHVDQ